MKTNEEAKRKYEEMVKNASPNSPILKNCVIAFFSGGLICTFGQFLLNFYQNNQFSAEDAATLTSVTLIFISSVLTALGIYSKLGKHCGAGTIVPITGFSNSVTSPAIEFKKEGMVLGVGAKMFLVAGPVLVYGILASMLVGVFYYFGGR